jgi:ABC-type glycerol-3-phosphate transport system substrate-binding protein
MRGTGATLAALLAALALAACGGDGDDSGGGEQLSKQEFIEQADAVCAESADAEEAAQAKLESATDPEEAADAYEEFGDVARGVNEEINALGRPEGDEKLIDDLAAKQEQLVALVDDLAAAVRAEDQAEAEAVGTELNTLSEEAGKILDSYGFEVC